MKSKLVFAVLMGLVAAFCSSCKNSSDDTNEGSSYAVDETLPPVAEGYIRINTLATKATNIWVWDDFDKAEVDKCVDGTFNMAGTGVQKTGENGDFVYFDLKLADDPSVVSFIIRNGISSVSGKEDISFSFPHKYNEIYLKSGNGTVYVDSGCREKPKGLVSAEITGEKQIKPTVSNATLSTTAVKVMDVNGKPLTVTNVTNTVISVSESLKAAGSVIVEYTDDLGTDTRTAGYSSTLIDTWFNLEDADIARLGYKDGVFTTWAPLALNVQVVLFADADSCDSSKTDSYKEANVIDMKRNENGTWQTVNVATQVASNKYYKYRITHGTTKKDVADIWAKASSYESTASQIAEITPVKYKNPWSGSDYTEAVIYEMHITDWSQAFRASLETDSPGTFQEITAALGTNGDGKFGQHLKDLGVTHVQILPMFEYAVTTKKASANAASEENNNAYNWGYNPYHYNVPESRYAKNMKDGTDAVNAMQNMISAFHDAGIAVIMDVVYNHTNGTGDGSLYDMTVPGYFYRDKDYTGCGNAVSTDHKMVRKYVIESLKHWMNDYGINGFRFDLMGVHEQEMMKEVYTELSRIDSNVMVYGEPWTANDYPTDGCKGAVDVTSANGGNGVGAFDDDFRDAIKGAEYGGFHIGQVQGSYNDDGIVNGLLGKSAGKNNRNETDKPGLALHYVECHDNYTLFDKLAYSSLGDSSIIGKDDFADKFPSEETIAEKIKDIKAQDKLAAAYVLLSQGTPFINGGQEFLRTKKGDPDSYAADTKGGVFWSNIDAVNAIDLKRRDTYSDVYNTYRGLIALRKDNHAAFGSNANASTETLAEGVTKYITGDFTVFFNATDDDYNLDDKVFLSGSGVSIAKQDYALTRGVSGKVITIDDEEKTDKGYKIAESATSVKSVPAKSFVILKK